MRIGRRGPTHGLVGLGIFGLTALNRTDSYDHTAAPYEPSSLVANYYSSNARYPESWADPALQAIFEANTTSASPSSSSPTSTPSAPTNSKTGTSSSASGQSSTGAVAGGVAVGVVALAIIGVAIFCFVRKKRPSNQTNNRRRGKKVPVPSRWVIMMGYLEPRWLSFINEQ
jgi:hypothetical protein